MFLLFAEPNKIETCLKLFCIVLGLHKVPTWNICTLERHINNTHGTVSWCIVYNGKRIKGIGASFWGRKESAKTFFGVAFVCHVPLLLLLNVSTSCGRTTWWHPFSREWWHLRWSFRLALLAVLAEVSGHIWRLILVLMINLESFDGANHLYHSSHVGLEARTVTGSELELPDLVWTHAFFGCSWSACTQTRFRRPASAPHAAAVRSSHAGEGGADAATVLASSYVPLSPDLLGRGWLSFSTTKHGVILITLVADFLVG